MPLRRQFLALAAASLCLPVLPARAAAGLLELQLIERDPRTALRTWRHRGEDWVAGRPGARYAVALANRSAERLLVVLSVDGVNAVSGETAATSQTGYVLGPYETAEITGWRKSLTEAAAFYFTALPDSYAARTGRPDNVGVIGVAVFRERAPDHVAQRRSAPGIGGRAADETRSESPMAAPAPSESARSEGAVREPRLGTGHGSREYSPTSQTTFERASAQPDQVLKLRYDSDEHLVALGVIRPRRLPAAPEPFPAFVPDPKG